MQVPRLIIKKCTLQDVPTIVSVALQSYREHYTYLWWDEGESYMKRNFSDAVIREELKQDNSSFYLLLTGDEPVGFLKLNDEKALVPYSRSECLELERIYLLDKVTGKGIGKMAIDFVVHMAWQKSRKIVWLKAMDGSPAVRFYESQGFKVTDTFALDLPHIKNDKRGMLVMEKKLPQDKSETGMIEWHFIPG